METIVKINDTSHVVVHENNEESLWKKVGELMYQEGFPVPATIKVSLKDSKGFATVVVEKATVQGGKEEKINIKLLGDSIRLPKIRYQERMLRRVDSDLDILKRYDMRPNSMGKITINIGAISGDIGRKGFDRIEDGIVHSPFPSQLYWLRYFEKISAGYQDYTDMLAEDEEESKIAKFFAKPDESEMQDDAVQELYKILTNAAKDNLTNSGIILDFYGDQPPYTSRQVNTVRKLYLKMCDVDTIEEMNELIETFLVTAAPKRKKGTKVSDFLVEPVIDEEQQKKVILEKLEWVNSIVSSMEAVVSMNQKTTVTYTSPFGDIEMSRLSDEDMNAFIEAEIPKINERQIDNIISIFDVKPKDQTKKYEKYFETTFGKKESLLFHGSPTCNWVSIIKNSLSLNPNAAITGKAFGNGIYFAPDSDKSAGYMSNRGSRWNSGDDSYVVMGIYRVATGTPYYGVNTIGGAPERTKELKEMFKKEGYDSFWYKANSGYFVRDEVIIYEENACVLDKLLVLKF